MGFVLQGDLSRWALSRPYGPCPVRGFAPMGSVSSLWALSRESDWPVETTPIRMAISLYRTVTRDTLYPSHSLRRQSRVVHAHVLGYTCVRIYLYQIQYIKHLTPVDLSSD